MVLGHISKTEGGTVPPEQQMRRHTHSPGSGKLVVEVISDGPTRLLRIRDVNKKVKISWCNDRGRVGRTSEVFFHAYNH